MEEKREIKNKKSCKVKKFLRKLVEFPVRIQSIHPKNAGNSNTATRRARRRRCLCRRGTIVPVEARVKPKNGVGVVTQEPTSPRVNCIGRVKCRRSKNKNTSRRRNRRCSDSGENEGRNRKKSVLVESFFDEVVSVGEEKLSKVDDVVVDLRSPTPPLCQMNRFSSCQRRSDLGVIDKVSNGEILLLGVESEDSGGQSSFSSSIKESFCPLPTPPLFQLNRFSSCRRRISLGGFDEVSDGEIHPLGAKGGESGVINESSYPPTTTPLCQLNRFSSCRRRSDLGVIEKNSDEGELPLLVMNDKDLPSLGQIKRFSCRRRGLMDGLDWKDLAKEVVVD